MGKRSYLATTYDWDRPSVSRPLNKYGRAGVGTGGRICLRSFYVGEGQGRRVVAEDDTFIQVRAGTVGVAGEGGGGKRVAAEGREFLLLCVFSRPD